MTPADEIQKPASALPKTDVLDAAQRAASLLNVVKKTRLARLQMVKRLRREGTLWSIGLVVGNLLTIAVAVLGMVSPLSVHVNVFVIAFSVLGLVASGYELGSKPERLLSRVYESAKQMAGLLHELESLLGRAMCTHERVDEIARQYDGLVGEVDENHSTSDYMTSRPDISGGSAAFWWIVGSLKTAGFLIVLLVAAIVAGGVLLPRAGETADRDQTPGRTVTFDDAGTP